MIGVLYYVSRFGTYRSQWVRARRPLNRFLRVRVLASFHHLVSSSSVLNECPFCGVTTRLESLFLSSRDAPRAPLSSVTRRRSVGEDERGTVLGEELARGVRARRCGGRWIVLRCRRQWIHGHLREVSARAVAVRESARARARWMRAGDRGVGEARRRARVDGGRAREDAWTRGCDENARVERFFCVCHVILRILD